MTFTIGLLSIFGLLFVPAWAGLHWSYLKTGRDKARVAFALMFIFSGVTHFTNTMSFAQMIPPNFPAPVALVYLSGFFELLGAIGLLIPIPRIQRLSAYGIVMLLVVVFPANVYAANSDIVSPGMVSTATLSSTRYLWLRLPLQALFIGWVLWSVGPSSRTVALANVDL